mmetsp:Transcript_6279/g.15262  ORF Transcript_6279/g.15262 Transcript_6279/m.15262 type:complete len:217 (+) Transcript_6279:470-1120(+)
MCASFSSNRFKLRSDSFVFSWISTAFSSLASTSFSVESRCSAASWYLEASSKISFCNEIHSSKSLMAFCNRAVVTLPSSISCCRRRVSAFSFSRASFFVSSWCLRRRGEDTTCPSNRSSSASFSWSDHVAAANSSLSLVISFLSCEASSRLAACSLLLLAISDSSSWHSFAITSKASIFLSDSAMVKFSCSWSCPCSPCNSSRATKSWCLGSFSSA